MTLDSLDVENARRSTAKSFTIVRIYPDNSGAIAAYGVYGSVDEAIAARAEIEDVLESFDSFEILPLFRLVVS